MRKVTRGAVRLWPSWIPAWSRSRLIARWSCSTVVEIFGTADPDGRFTIIIDGFECGQIWRRFCQWSPYLVRHSG